MIDVWELTPKQVAQEFEKITGKTLYDTEYLFSIMALDYVSVNWFSDTGVWYADMGGFRFWHVNLSTAIGMVYIYNRLRNQSSERPKRKRRARRKASS